MKSIFKEKKESKLDEKTVIELIKIADSKNDFEFAMKLITIGSENFKNSLSFHGFVGDFLGEREQALTYNKTSGQHQSDKITSKL